MTRATFGGVPVRGGSEDVAWAITMGVKPHTDTFTVNKRDWPKIQAFMGLGGAGGGGTAGPRPVTPGAGSGGQTRGTGPAPQELVIRGLNGSVTLKGLYPLYEVPSDSPNRHAFMVADRRWMWPYKLVVADFNITRKTGDRRILKEDSEQPIQTFQYVDTFRYMTYSLHQEQRRHTARTVLERVMKTIEPGNFHIDSMPVEGDGEQGLLSIQNLMMRDAGDVAISRAISHIPGLNVYVWPFDDTVHAFDAADIPDTETYLRGLEEQGISNLGEWPRKIDRSAIRPKRVFVHFVREMECRFDYSEDLSAGATVSPPREDDPFIMNVLPLPDVLTPDVRMRREDGGYETVEAVQGTWVEVSEALKAWQKTYEPPLPYAFDPAIKNGFVNGMLDEWWADIKDVPDQENAQARIQAFNQHWRQTFQVNPKYMARIREIRGIRIAKLDPVTNTRATAMAWSQYAIVPTFKATRYVLENADPKDFGLFFNRDSYPGYDEPLDLNEASGAVITVLDAKLGVFRVDYPADRFGMQGSSIPSLIVEGGTNKQTAMRRALRNQDRKPMIAGAAVEGVNGIQVSPRFSIAVILTLTTNAPNDKGQLHGVEVDLGAVKGVYKSDWGIEGGNGPDLDVFVPPSVCTARFGWLNTQEARKTISDIMGTLGDDDVPGLDPERGPMPGFTFVNGRDEIPANAQAAAVSALLNTADTVAGGVVTKLWPDARPRGAIRAISHGVSGPGGVRTSSAFRDGQLNVNAYAMLPDSVRHITLGIIPYGKDDR